MHYSLLLKPVSSACNLHCRYCYYRPRGPRAVQKNASFPKMGDEVLEGAIRAYMQTAQEIYSMVWHGGEPSLLPRGFYEKAVALQKRYAGPGSRIANSIQTNGTLVSEDLAAFMAHYRFLCGVSLDGPAPIHDRSRRTAAGKGTHDRVWEGITTLAAAGVPVNILVLVSAANVHRPLEVYRYLKRRGAAHIQFIPCVEYDDDGGLREYAVDGEAWGAFLLAVFDAWFRHDIGIVSVRLFEAVLARLVHDVAIDCYNGDACNRYLVVEHNGDVFPCDFFVRPAYKLGNILEHTFEEILASEPYRAFAARKRKWPDACETCEYRYLCMGDCLKFRRAGSSTSNPISVLCPGWKAFYGQTLDRFRQLANGLILRTAMRA